MSWVWAKSTPGLRSTSAFSGTAARSSARTSLSDPLAARPIGVRMASTMTASGIRGLLELTRESIVRGAGADLRHRPRGEATAGGERLARLRAVQARAEEAGREGVAGAGRVDDVGRLRRHVDIAPAGTAGAELDD